MNLLSKCFKHMLSTVNCTEIVHPHTNSCMQAAWTSFLKPVPTTAKFFLPLFLISLATKRDKIDGSACRELFATFLSATFAAFFTGTIGRWFMCILFNLLNRFTYYSIVCIPAVLGSSVIFATSNKISIMFAHSVLVMILQVLIRKGEFTFFRRIYRSPWFRTLTFMSLSGILLDSMKYVKPDISWLLQPLRSRFSGPSHSNESTNPEQICSHKAECYEFNKKELKLYSNVAIAIELVRNTIKYFKYLKSRPLRGIAKIIRSINLKFILFAVGYPSSYRILTCLFNGYSGCGTEYGNIVSAFLSAIFFYAYPNIPIFAHALACTIEILWQRLLQSKLTSNLTVLQKINDLPIAKLFHVFGCGYLFHVRTFFPWQTPSILMKIMCLVTNDHSDKMIINLASAFIT